MREALIIVLTAMTPIGELRAAIPLGLTSYDLSWPAVMGLAVAGNLVPVPFILWGLHRLGGAMERMNNPLGALFRWRTTRLRHGSLTRRRYSFFAILLLVAIPLPLTGAWTGSLAVWTLHIPLRRGLSAIAAGVVVAGAVVTALSLAGIELVRLTGQGA